MEGSKTVSKCPYTCPRCGYTTRRKDDIRHHLYRNKRMCPGQLDDLELTDEVKECVLSNRVYKVEKVPSVVQTIHNNNTIINYIAGLDVVEKLMKYVGYNNLRLEDFESKVEKKYRFDVERFQNHLSRHNIELTTTHLLDAVDSLSSINTKELDKGQHALESLNLLYDEGAKKIRFFEGNAWEEYREDAGLEKIIQTMADNYLYAYESYLISRLEIEGLLGSDRANLLTCLEEFYVLLCTFRIQPFVQDKCDSEILLHIVEASTEMAHTDDIEAHRLVDKYLHMYSDILTRLKPSQKRELRNNILGIIKRNTEYNKNELNKHIHDLIKMDTTFRKNVLGV
jgi:hypothetical protein